MNKEDMGIVAWKGTQEELKKRLEELPDGRILVVPLGMEREVPIAVRTRKRLNSYGQRAAALNG